ncbi:MAG TPA: hypothetical protein VLA79_05345, partial [Polyangia bacterium]|nr:hypothetical protein [Polyangia bacterium]
MSRSFRARGGPRRRDLLLGGAGAASLTGLGLPAMGAAPLAPTAPAPNAIDVDVHCHTFCAADLPIVGFVAHYIPGLTDLSRLLTRWPELIVRTLVGAVATLPNAAAPSGDDELASL